MLYPIDMTTLSTTIVLFLGFFLPFVPLARSAEEPIVVNIAAAYSSEINDGWARYLYWQQPGSNKLVVRRRGKHEESVEIHSTITPRKNSHLAAHYISDRESPEQHNVGLFLSHDAALLRRFELTRHAHSSLFGISTRITRSSSTPAGMRTVNISTTLRRGQDSRLPRVSPLCKYRVLTLGGTTSMKAPLLLNRPRAKKRDLGQRLRRGPPYLRPSQSTRQTSFCSSSPKTCRCLP